MNTLFAGITDEVLVNQFAQGNEKAFNALLERYHERLYRYIFFYIHDSEQTEDLLQDTFLKVVSNIRQGRYLENGRFAQWITRIARNLVIDYCRHIQLEQTLSTDEENRDYLNNIKYAEDNIENFLVREQILSDVRKMIDFLPDEQQQVVRMRYYDNLSFKEISQQTGVSMNTSLGRMHYAIQNMRRMAKKQVALC